MYVGWDFLDGGACDDLIHGCNGRGIIAGIGELYGDFRLNAYMT